MISKSPEGLQYDEGRLKFLRDERGKLDAACQTGEQISRRKATLALRAVVVSLAFITIGCQKVGMEPEKARKQLDQNAIELLYKQADLVNDALKKYTPEVFGLPENEYKARIRSEAFTFLLNREQSEFPDLFPLATVPSPTIQYLNVWFVFSGKKIQTPNTITFGRTFGNDFR